MSIVATIAGSSYRARDLLVANFRRQVSRANQIVALEHQAEWRLATEGYTLQPRSPRVGEAYEDVLLPLAQCPAGAMVTGTIDIRGLSCVVVRRAITPRFVSLGLGPIAAHICADLAAFKAGKSFYAALWASGFAVLGRTCQVDFIGVEYSTSEPEFNYLLDFLCSERGMNMPYQLLHNDSDHGRMKLVLDNGAQFACRSWERAHGLKGKRRIAYVYTEAYQLPGLEVYTTLSQNLRELQGFALFPTTPDRPWVGVFHDYAHAKVEGTVLVSGDPDWHCTCSVDAQMNPYTFSQHDRDRDDPEKGGIMTRERFAIAWRGQLGRFIGKVYEFSRGDRDRYFSPESHPRLWAEGIVNAAPPADAGEARDALSGQLAPASTRVN